MSSMSNAVLNGLSLGLYNTSNILFGGLTSSYMRNSGLTPFDTLYTNLDSPTGFSSWAHPSYASRFNLAADANGFDTTFAPLTSAFSSALSYGGIFGGGMFGSGSIFGGGFPTSNIFIDSKTFTHLGARQDYLGWA